MSPVPRKPTDAQLSILAVLWEHGPATVRQVHEALPTEVRRGYTTTLKLMQVMVEQGLLAREDGERGHVYRPRHARSEVQDELVRHLIERAFHGSAAKLVQRALSDRRASREELLEIRRLLDQAEAQRRPRR